MPRTFHVLWTPARSKFRLDAALPEAQLERGSQVPWDSDFIKDIRSGLTAVKPHLAAPNDLSVLVLLPVYVLVAVSEVFALVTGQAYAYKQAPPNMKSMLQGIYAVFNGVGYLFALAIGPTARNPGLVVMWASVTGVLGSATVVFWVCFRHYDQRASSA